jgi:hypothetical protein
VTDTIISNGKEHTLKFFDYDMEDAFFKESTNSSYKFPYTYQTNDTFINLICKDINNDKSPDLILTVMNKTNGVYRTEFYLSDSDGFKLKADATINNTGTFVADFNGDRM